MSMTRRDARRGRPGRAAARWAARLAAATAVAAWGVPAAASGFERPRLADAGQWGAGPVQLVLVLLLAMAAFLMVNWALKDIRRVRTEPGRWAALVLAGAVLGPATALLVPSFYAGFPLGVVVTAGAGFIYALHRNGQVPAAQRVLTGAHVERVKRRLRGEAAEEPTRGPVIGVGRDIIFLDQADLPIKLEALTDAEREGYEQTERVLYDAIVRQSQIVGVLVRRQGAQVRFRAGGQVIEGGDVAHPAAEFLAAGLKRLANLNPAETRKPQEGRFRAVVAGQTFECRVKTAGSVRGEQVSVRIIDPLTSRMALEDLGLNAGQLGAVKAALEAKPGIVVVSSPKNGGLTTTLHACLRHYDRYMNNVVCFDPHVDLEVESVRHVGLNQEEGEAAARQVREAVLAEADVVAVDSLSSPEVGRVLADAAADRRILIGLRASDAGQALARVAQLLGAAAPLAGALRLVVNQRLVRLLCDECKEGYRPNPEFLRKANLASQKVDVLYRPPKLQTDEKGRPVVCPVCHNVRFRGQTGLFEVMDVDEAARQLIGAGASVSDVRTHARKGGMRNLQEEGLRLVIEGRTAIEEVLRAIKQSQ